MGFIRWKRAIFKCFCVSFLVSIFCKCIIYLKLSFQVETLKFAIILTIISAVYVLILHVFFVTYFSFHKISLRKAIFNFKSVFVLTNALLVWGTQLPATSLKIYFKYLSKVFLWSKKHGFKIWKYSWMNDVSVNVHWSTIFNTTK